LTKIIRKDDDSLADGNISALPDWSERYSKLYDGETSRALKRQNHTCGHCQHKFTGDERVHLHHSDGNHDNWKTNNIVAVHESCHDYIHMGKKD
jgi:RNA-directed DNA polymerase